MACTRRCGLMTQMTIGVVLSLLFSILVIVWPTIFLNILRNMSVLTKDSYSFNLWKETPLPMYLELYLYNFTNSREVLEDNSIKPHFVDVGPYVFQERHYKVNLTWHDNGTVTFLQRRVWHFDPDLSKGDLSDEITNINIIAVTAGYMVRHRSLFVRLAVSSALNVYEKLIITKTARELLFEGYSDGLLEVIKTLNIPEISLPFDQFGWFYGRNNTDTYDGWWNIQTGANDLKTLGDMDLWNFNDRVDYYDGECGAVKGGTGELFAPRTDPEIVSVFASDICSYISLKRNGSAEMRGLKGAVFTGDDSPFDNGDRYPNEACFCHKGDVCVPAGSRNISQCKFGAPAFISYPHFYLADPSYVSRIDGVTPNETLDQFKLGLNLATGIPLFVRAQLQINILLQRIPNIAMFEQMPDDLFIPMLWFKQEVTIDEELASKARIAASIENIISIVLYTLIGIGVVLFCVGLFLLYKFPLRRTESEASLIR